MAQPSVTNTLVPIILQNGINNKVDEKVLQTNLIALENRFMTKLGRLEKRSGFTALGNKDSAGATIGSGNKLAVFGDDLLLLNQDKLYSYVSSKDNWQIKGNLTTSTVNSTPSVRNANSQYLSDIAHLNGISVTVWEEQTPAAASAGVFYSVVDTTSNSSLVASTLISATAKAPKVVALANGFLIFYLDGAGSPYDLVTSFISNASLTSITANAPVASGYVKGTVYDVINYQGAAVYAIHNTSDKVTVGYVNETGAASVLLPSPFVDVTADNATAMGLTKDELTDSIFLALSTATAVKLWRVDSGLAGGVTNLVSAAIETVSNVAVVTPVYSNGKVKVFYEVGNRATPINQKINYNSAVWDNLARTLTASTARTIARSVGLASKAFTDTTNAYCATVFPSTIQPVYFVIDETGQVVAKVAQGLGGLLSTDSSSAASTHVSSVPVDAAGNFIFSAQIRTRYATLDGTGISATFGLNAIGLNLADFSYNSDTLGNNLVISGGIVSAYDGNSVTELGFNVFPEGVTAVESAGGSLANGAYSYQVLYEWTDAKGQLHRSAPSIIATVTTAAAKAVTVTAPSLRLSKKTGVKVVFYRTIAGGDIYYRAGEVANTAGADTVVFTDGVADTTLRAKEILYTTGGILDNIAPPACKIVHRHQNRMFLAGLENVDTFWYSKEYVPGEGIGFSDGLVQQNDARGGSITALGTLDDKLLIFKDSATFFMSGNGPLDTGANNDYIRPQLVQGDVGAKGQDSIVITPAGVMFQSDKGIWQIDRALAMSYLGAPAEDFNSLIITGAVVVADSNQVRFTTVDGTMIVYDYYFQQWYTFTNYYAASSVIWAQNYVHLTTNGKVHKDVPGSYNDNGAKIKTKIETGWLVPGGLQGFQRIRDILLLGEYNGEHTVSVKLAYDYEKVYNETVLFAADEVYNTNLYGSGAFYGTLSPFGGGTPSAYQFVIKPARQKCESFKLVIEDIDNKQGGGPAFSLTAISCWVGLKSNRDRLPAIQSGGN